MYFWGKPQFYGVKAQASNIGHGVGNIVYRLSKSEKISIREAGVALSEGKDWDKAAALFEGGAN